jgi:hypothetical protein
LCDEKNETASQFLLGMAVTNGMTSNVTLSLADSSLLWQDKELQNVLSERDEYIKVVVQASRKVECPLVDWNEIVKCKDSIVRVLFSFSDA